MTEKINCKDVKLMRIPHSHYIWQIIDKGLVHAVSHFPEIDSLVFVSCHLLNCTGTKFFSNLDNNAKLFFIIK